MPKLKFFILFSLLPLFSLLSLLFTPFSLLAAEETAVTVTVSTELISVSVSPTNTDYGVLNFGAQNATPTDDPDFVVKNEGTVNENFNLRGADAVNGTDAWLLSATAGPDQYVHKYLPAGVGTTTALTKAAGGTGLATGITPTSTASFKLRLSMPTSSSGASGQYSTTVTVIATKTL